MQKASAAALCTVLTLAAGATQAGPLSGALSTVSAPTSAISAPSAANVPVASAVQSVGNVVTAVGQGHAGIAPIVYGTAPAVEPFTDSVTNGLVGVGQGLNGTGSNISTTGLQVTPVTGVQKVVKTIQNGTLLEVRAGSTSLGNSANPIVSVGAVTSAPVSGTLATAGVANANALLNANVAPQ